MTIYVGNIENHHKHNNIKINKINVIKSDDDQDYCWIAIYIHEDIEISWNNNLKKNVCGPLFSAIRFVTPTKNHQGPLGYKTANAAKKGLGDFLSIDGTGIIINTANLEFMKHLMPILTVETNDE